MWDVHGDDDHVFLAYAIGRRFASQGLIELDAKTGQQEWKTPTMGTGFQFLKSTGTELVAAVRFHAAYRLGVSFRE